MELQWNKNPAVLTGGKQWFYTTRDKHGAMWHVVWDRAARQWCVDNSHSPDKAYFDTAAKGRRFVQDVLDIADD